MSWQILPKSYLFTEIVRKSDELFVELVKKAYEVAKIIGEQVVKIFDQYTPHDIEHCENAVYDLENKLFDPDKIIEVVKNILENYENFANRRAYNELRKTLGLSVAEIQLLIRGIFLHDAGMAPPNDVLKEFKSKHKQAYESCYEKYKDEKEALAEFIRRFHQDISAVVIEKYTDKLYGEYIEEAWAQDELKVLKFIVKHHRTPIDKIPDYAREEFGQLDIQIDYPNGQQLVRPALLAALVQLADELDIDYRRVKRLAYKMFIENPKSKAHWLSHLKVSIKRIREVYDVFLSFEGDFKLKDDEDKDVLVEAYRLAINNANKLREKLRKFRLTELSKENIEPIYGMIPIDVIPRLRAIGFQVETAKIEVHGNITSLLADKLYAGDESVIIREFLANSIDACLYRYSVDEEFRKRAIWYADWCKERGKWYGGYELPYYEPENFDIIAWGVASEKEYHEKLAKGQKVVPFYVLKDCIQIDWSENEDYMILKIEDHGKGMTIDEIKRCFVAIGYSWWHTERVAKSFNPIAKFGVGHLSAFMLGEKIVVTTRPLNNDRAYRFELTPNVGDYITVWEVDRDDYGTTVEIWIPKNSDRTKRFLEKVKEKDNTIHEWTLKAIDRWFVDFTRHISLNGDYKGISGNDVVRVGIEIKISDKQILLKRFDDLDIPLYLDKLGYVCHSCSTYIAEMGQIIDTKHDIPCFINTEFPDIIVQELSKSKAYINDKTKRLAYMALILEALRKGYYIFNSVSNEVFEKSKMGKVLATTAFTELDEECCKTIVSVARKYNIDLERKILVVDINEELLKLYDVWKKYSAIVLAPTSIVSLFSPFFIYFFTKSIKIISECLKKNLSKLKELGLLIIPQDVLPLAIAHAMSYRIVECPINNNKGESKDYGKILIILKGNLKTNLINKICRNITTIIRNCIEMEKIRYSFFQEWW